MVKYRLSLDDVKDAGLVKGVVTSKLNELTAATEKSIEEVGCGRGMGSGC
jgi:hypothetical protein